MAIVGALALAVAAVSGAIGGGSPVKVRDHPAPVPIEAPVVELPAVACDSWCQWVREGYGVAAQGNISDVIYAAAQANGVPEMAGWGLVTATCESGLRPWASNGWHQGLFQMDPSYWPSRAEGAGFPDSDPYDPVANAFTAMHMVATGYSLSHWSCSPW